jgi:type I restriction enzyme S subunit
MKLTFTKYEAYKNSDVDWLGAVPAKWTIVRNKEVFKERSSLSTTGKETLLTVSHITGVTPRSEKNVNMFMAETMEGYKICHPGDLIINTMWAWMGALGTSHKLGICSPSYNVYMPIKGVPYNHRYFDYLFRIPNAIVEMTRNSKGIVSSRLRLYAKDFFQIETVLPSLKEQEAIAHYLDTKTDQIDRKIDLLTQKATLYGNLKQSIINETVTRGLDKSLPMKDSGIEWIGEIPKNWKLHKISQSFERIGSGTTPKTGSEVYYKDGTVNWINTGDLNDGLLTECKRKVTPEALRDHSLNVYPIGSIVIAMYGATIGKLSILQIEGCTNQACCVLKKSKILETRFLFYWFISKRDFIISLSYGGGQPNISQDTIKSLRVPVPLFSDQSQIADYLETKTTQIDRIIQSINTQIQKLKELRKTLINDVVTGKIKVV